MGADDLGAILAGPDTDPRLVESCQVALHRTGAEVTVIRAGASGGLGTRSALLDNDVVLAAADAADFVVDLSRPGLDHDPEIEFLLGRGCRVLVIDIDDPADLAREVPHAGLGRRVEGAVRRLHLGDVLAVGSPAGTDLAVVLEGARATGRTGIPAGEGSIARWPSGRVTLQPAPGALSGTVVVMPGDVNHSFRGFVRSPVRLTVERDRITEIDGDSSDADVIRATLESAPGDEAYVVTELGWGMVRALQRDLGLFDEQFLRLGHRLEGVLGLATGREPIAGRPSRGRLDLGLRGCSISVDGVALVAAGVLQGNLAPDVYEEAAIEAIRQLPGAPGS